MKAKLYQINPIKGLLLVAVVTALTLGSLQPGFGQGVPVRLSFKFILNASGNRPATGNLNTDAEIVAQVVRGNGIFSRFISELQFVNIEILDVAGCSQWYLASPNPTDLANLRSAARGDPATYGWRSDAVNLYITGADGSAITYYPPDNDIVLVSQGAWDTSVAHELGHILNLKHTQDSDGCADTLPDNEAWTRDDIAVQAFGVVYAACTPAQQAQVDMTWNNLMSYHDPNNRSMLSSCQMDRQSTQAYGDRNWLLSKLPVYVDALYGGTHDGSFTQPYQTIQQAINAGVLNGKTMVLKQGVHARPASPVGTATDVVTRKGTSTVQDAPPDYSLSFNLEESTNAAVRQAIVRAQRADRRRDIGAVVASLLEAEKHADGRERSAIRLELAERLRDSQHFQEAAAWFQKVADDADQPGLKRVAQARVKAMNDEVDRHKK